MGGNGSARRKLTQTWGEHAHSCRKAFGTIRTQTGDFLDCPTFQRVATSSLQSKHACFLSVEGNRWSWREPHRENMQTSHSKALSLTKEANWGPPCCEVLTNVYSVAYSTTDRIFFLTPMSRGVFEIHEKQQQVSRDPLNVSKPTEYLFFTTSIAWLCDSNAVATQHIHK